MTLSSQQTNPHSGVPGKHFKEDGMCLYHGSPSCVPQIMTGISCQQGLEAHRDSSATSLAQPCPPPVLLPGVVQCLHNIPQCRHPQTAQEAPKKLKHKWFESYKFNPAHVSSYNYQLQRHLLVKFQFTSLDNKSLPSLTHSW